MRNGVGFHDHDERAWLEGVDRAQVELVRGKTKLADGAPKRRWQSESPVPGGLPPTIGDEEYGHLERVGRRHLIRPELGALAVGAIFILAALVKPWGTVARVPSPSASASASAFTNDAPLVNVQAPQEPPLPPYLADLARGWAGVDWSFLSMNDTHVGWGIAAATMPEVKTSTPRSTLQVPAVFWVPVPTAAPATVVDVGPNDGVFALAITWPADLRVTDITVEYLGSGYDPPYVTSGGFQPYTQLSPLRADSVVTPTGQPSEASPRSGEFWVPPAIASPVTADRSAEVAWHELPWPWPLGGYKITVNSQHVPTILALFLRQTPGTAAS
ncbi:MAG TPA: hypothetical protein VIK06_11005 [Candidatus Limnocylindrales bacterium]